MGLQVRFEEASGYLSVLVSGRYSLADFLDAIDRIGAESSALRARCVLINLLGIVGHIPDLDRYDLGLRAADALGRLDKLACIAALDQVNYLAENVAQNRGLNVRVFVDEAAALAWIAAPAEDPALVVRKHVVIADSPPAAE